MRLSLFNRSADDTRLERLTVEIRTLSQRVAELKGERDAVGTETTLSKRIIELEREKTEKEIALARVLEDHQREKREIDHKIGLHRQRVEQEIELSRKEAVLDVREENLTKDRERFEKEMDYTRERFSEEVERLATLQKEILERLPKWSVDRKITEAITSGARNGGSDGDDGD
jgi:DNA anti-recombination protein RmuC